MSGHLKLFVSIFVAALLGGCTAAPQLGTDLDARPTTTAAVNPAASPAAASEVSAVQPSTIPARLTPDFVDLHAPSPGDSQDVTLTGNVHPLAQPEFDRGEADSATRLDRMMLLLSPSPAQQAALDALVAAQHDPDSPLFHHWLTPGDFGARFGADDATLQQVAAWLASQGFSIEEIPTGRRLIVFSGNVGQVYDAFHTPLHTYSVNGALHLANSMDPQIPAGLAGVVAGVVSLHDFRRASQIGAHKPMNARPQYSAGSTDYIFPGDFAAIYDLNPLYEASIKGAGTSIAIAGRSNINLSDAASFRSMANLPANNPSVVLVGSDPGLVTGDQDESTLDVEWSGAVAPAASVHLVIAASTATTDGIDLAAQYIVNHAVSPIVSVSYGSCERSMGVAELAFYNELWEQAASQGMSVFVSSGDAGAADCSSATSATGSAAAVNGLCSSPYATCVGGTEFNESSNAAQYWSTTNSAGYASALGYIPEEVWNESSANGGTGLWASGGGASVVYTQPSWQAELNGASAANGMRAVPDIALSAADHDGYFVTENGAFWIDSGTSVAAPAFAGIMALVEQKQGTPQGNASPALYALVNAEQNPFHATPSGNNSVPDVAGFTARGAAYNLATGLGSVDGRLLVDAWGARSTVTAPTLTLAANAPSVTVAQGRTAAIAFTVGTGGSFAGSVQLAINGLPAGITAVWSANPTASMTGTMTTGATLTLTASSIPLPQSSSIAVTASGDGLTASQNITVLTTPQQNSCARFSLLTTHCRPARPVPFQ